MLKPYPYKATGKKKGANPVTLTYSFKDYKDRKFVIEAECYSHNLYAVKFYPHHYRESDDKFRIITNYGQPGRLIGTCLRVILELYTKNPRASFGILGVNSINEDKANTARYRFYKMAIGNTISPTKFLHQKYPDQSLYVLVNRQEVGKDSGFVQKIEKTIEALLTDYFKGAEQEKVIPVHQRKRIR